MQVKYNDAENKQCRASLLHVLRPWPTKDPEGLPFPPFVKINNENVDRHCKESQRQPCRNEDPELIADDYLFIRLVEIEEIHSV